MEIVTDNAYVKKVIMMIIKKINVNNALFHFGFFINNLYTIKKFYASKICY